jgi:hypothetical protein
VPLWQPDQVARLPFGIRSRLRKGSSNFLHRESLSVEPRTHPRRTPAR